MYSDMLLLAERLVLAVETISEDVKNMSAYVYELNCSVSHFLDNKTGKVDISVVTGSESGSPPCDPPANEEEDFTESKYSLPCEQVNGSSVPHIDDVKHEEMSVWGVGCMSNDQAESSNVLASITGGIRVEEPSENNENGMDSSSDTGRNIVRDHMADIKDEIDIHEDFFPLPEETDVLVTMRSPEVEVIKNGANFVVKEEAIDTEETPLSKFEEETASSPSNLLCEDPVKDETVDVNLVYEQQSTARMAELPEHYCLTPDTCEINSAYLMSRISIQNKSEEAHGENGELLKGCCRESPQEGCSDTAASFSCSAEPLGVQDVEENDQSEKCSRKCSGVGERRPKKSMPCNRETQSSSSNKTSSKQSGRQKQTRKRFCCDSCCKCFLSMVHLENHKRKHTGEKPFCCALCNKACATKNNLSHHMKVHSEGGPYKCSSCDKSFKESGSLKSHMRLHSEEKPFCCALCNKTFSTKNNLAHHLKVHSEERPYKCSTCNKSFKRGRELVEHMRLHSGEKPFECSVCKKAFTQSTHLTIHMRTHTGKKPYKCTECGKAFTHSGALTCHMRLHSGEKPFVCTECGKAFTHSGALTRHMRLHSGEKPFVCTECGKAFTHSGALTCHMRLHSGEKPFVCTECGKAFTQSSNLQSHLRTHTGECPFHCKNCESSFTHSNSLKRHRRLVHGVASPVS